MAAPPDTLLVVWQDEIKLEFREAGTSGHSALSDNPKLPVVLIPSLHQHRFLLQFQLKSTQADWGLEMELRESWMLAVRAESFG